jgi:hypothetical protein
VLSFSLLLCWLGIHCGIYKNSYNISHILYLSTPPPALSHSWNSFNTYFSIHIYVYTVFAPYLPSFTISPPPPNSHWYQLLQEGPQKCHKETPCVTILNNQKCHFFSSSSLLIQNQRTGGGTSPGWIQNSCIYIYVYTHTYICWNYSRNGRMLEGVHSSILYVIYYKNFCKCHNVCVYIHI